MKLSLLALSIFSLISLSSFAQKKPDFYAKQWAKVEHAELYGLPQSANNVVNKIYAQAKKDKNVPQLVKALIYQTKFALVLEEDAELRVVQNLKREINSSTSPQRNILESILANLYWQHFKKNRQVYYNRSTADVKLDSIDFRLWDATGLFNEIDLHFQESLKGAVSLQSVDLSSINAILETGEGSKLYRPTLYDLLVHNAINFYKTNESAAPHTIVTEKLKDPRLFETFEFIPAHHSDSVPPAIQTLTLFHDLLTFHRIHKDTAAFINLELERLTYLVDLQNNPSTRDLKVAALETLYNNYSHHPASTLVDYELASIAYSIDDVDPSFRAKGEPSKKKDAVTYCRRAIKAFPGSDGARNCKLLLDKLLAQNISITAEKFIPIQKISFIKVEYTNIDTVQFEVFEITDSLLNHIETKPGDSIRYFQLHGLKPETSWTVGLPNLKDYLTHSTEIVFPALKGGQYVVVATVVNRNTHPWENYTYATIQVTNLSLLQIQIRDLFRYQALDRMTGKPIHGATIHIKFDSSRVRSNYKQPDIYRTTDENGFVSIKDEINDFHYGEDATIILTYQNDRVVNVVNLYSWYDPEDEIEKKMIHAQAWIFTDRSIYRPGQTVFFKGILTQTNNKKSSVVSGEYVTVTLSSHSGVEVGKLRCKTNSYGSFSGEYKLPASGETGNYIIEAEEGDDEESKSKFYLDLDNFYSHDGRISVEEYKRPTFEVTFLPVKETYLVNDSIHVTAVAGSFSGAKVSGSKVTYTVKRSTRFPWWFNRNYDHYYSNDKIAEGTGTTNEKGELEIRFKAIPEDKAEKADDPVFSYDVRSVVTDLNGETREGTQRIKVGYRRLIAKFTALEEVERKSPELSMDLVFENLNDQPVASKASIRVFKLLPNSTPKRHRPWEAPDLPSINREEFQKLFPQDTYEEEISNPAEWPRGKTVLETSYFTGSPEKLKVNISKDWQLGQYGIEAKTVDAGGDTITGLHVFLLKEKGNKGVSDQQLLLAETDKSVYLPGETIHLRVGSAAPDITVTIDIEKDMKIEKTYVEHFSGNVREFSFAAAGTTEAYYTVHVNSTGYNSHLQKELKLRVLPKIDPFEIETISFKDKLQPGAKENWSFVVKRAEQEHVAAEVMASMYDASLDKLRSHDWVFDPWPGEYYNSNLTVSSLDNFEHASFTFNNTEKIFRMRYVQAYDDFDWFGLSFQDSYSVRREYRARLMAKNSDTTNLAEVVSNKDFDLKKGFVRGKIINLDDGTPIPGVSIVIKGTTDGTSSDIDGNYLLNASKGNVLEFSFIGYKSVKVEVTQNNVFNVAMATQSLELNEVIVMSERTTKYAAASLGFSVSSPLQGSVAGVFVTPKDVALPSLIIVDGKIVSSYDLTNEDIYTKEILGSEAAMVLYGTKGVNGAIIITTKSGQKALDEQMAKVNARKNFNETAFFFPKLTTDEKGQIQFSFTTPESLTRWKLTLLAHTRDLLYARKTLQAVTQKQLMVTPNVPRFLRVGDEIIISAKITNLTDKKLQGNAAMQLTDDQMTNSVDALFKNNSRNQEFSVEANGTTQVSWKLNVPANVDLVQYKILAKAGSHSDGEQNVLPVLSNRLLVTETLPMFIRSGQTKTFTLNKLKNNTSSTLQNHRLTLEVTSSPAWYAVQSLPYLMEFPHECSEQLFARFYSNTLAQSIANHNPRIKQVFDSWASSDALISNLDKNPELKSVILEESPWLKNSQNEAVQKKHIAFLFDMNTMSNQRNEALTKLKSHQIANGGFNWFGGDYVNRYITQHIASGYGHLKKLNVLDSLDDAGIMIKNAVNYLDKEIAEDYSNLIAISRNRSIGADEKTRKKQEEEFMRSEHVSNDQIQYLYMRSFYPDLPLSPATLPAVEYYRNQTAVYWQNFSLYSRGMTALIQFRNKNLSLAKVIINSLKENSIVSEDLGMYWKENVAGWYWYQAPIEVQSLLIEAFSEIQSADKTISNDLKTENLDNLRTWLLKNKQTTQWKTTKETTEAIYALLLQGTDWLSVEDQLQVTVGSKEVIPDKSMVEAGTGYYKKAWKENEITPSMSEVKLVKKEKGIAWAGLYWQYFEDIDKITSSSSPLLVKRKLFLVKPTSKSEELKEVTSTTPLQVGDLIRVRIEIKSDRDMEFVHLKDLRAAGFEPVDVLSRYKWRDGLGYYMTTRDVATNFFFDHIPKGVYMVEYDVRVNNKGHFSNGIATIQCMYAPEFTSHSEGIGIQVK